MAIAFMGDMSAPAIQSQTTEIGELVGDVVVQATQLVRQQVQLLTSEVDVRQAGAATAKMGGGIALLAASGVLATASAVHLAQRVTRLPLWCCYGLAAGAAAIAGQRLFASGRDSAANLLQSGLNQTAESLKENARWVKDQVTRATE